MTCLPFLEQLGHPKKPCVVAADSLSSQRASGVTQEQREVVKGWGGVIIAMQWVMVGAQLCTSQPSRKRNPEGLRLGNGGRWNRHGQHPPKSGVSEWEGEDGSFSLLRFGATRDQMGGLRPGTT